MYLKSKNIVFFDLIRYITSYLFMKLLKLTLLRNKLNRKSYYTLFSMKILKSYPIKRQIIANLVRKLILRNTVWIKFLND